MSVPMTLPMERADRSFRLFISTQVGVFVVVGLVLNLLIWSVVVRPGDAPVALADRVSQGDLEAPEFGGGGKDEIGVLARSFAACAPAWCRR